MNDSVLYALSGEGVATLTLNRPTARNAVNVALCEALLGGARRALAESARLVLVRAAGPVFSAGADLKERQGMGEDSIRARRLKGFAAYDALERLPMPVIAVVEGPAIGAGVEIAAACDFVVATPAASFRTPEAIWGSVGATQRLPRVIGKRLAKDLMFTGRTLAAEAAREAGLVARVVPAETLEAALVEIVATILLAPPGALRLAKRCIDEGLERDPRGALATESLAIEESLEAAEWRARMEGFGR